MGRFAVRRRASAATGPMYLADHRVLSLTLRYQRVQRLVLDAVEPTLLALVLAMWLAIVALLVELLVPTAARAAAALAALGVVAAAALVVLLVAGALVPAVQLVHTQLAARIPHWSLPVEQLTLGQVHAAFNAPRPYRRKVLPGVRLPADAREVAVWRAAQKIRRDTADLGVADVVAAKLAAAAYRSSAPAASLLEPLRGLEQDAALQAVSLAHEAMRRHVSALPQVPAASTVMVQQRQQLLWEQFEQVLHQYARLQLSVEQRAAVQSLWPNWSGDVLELLDAVRSL